METTVKKCFLAMCGGKVFVLSVTARILAEFQEGTFGIGWAAARRWARDEGYEILDQKVLGMLATAKSKPGVYRRALFGWVEITKSEYMAALYGKMSNGALLLIEKPGNVQEWPKEKKNLVCIVRNGAWVEVRKDGRTLRGKWVGEDQNDIKPEIIWLVRWAEEEGYEIGNVRGKDGWVVHDTEPSRRRRKKGSSGDEGIDLPGGPEV